MVLIRVPVRTRISQRYTPPPIITEAADRFWAKTTEKGPHRVWNGRLGPRGERPSIDIRGIRFYVHDFAYRTHWGDIWPHLKAYATCSEPLCVQPAHLHLKRGGRTARAELTQADWDTIAELLYDRGDHAPHRHLVDAYDVAAVYGVEEGLALEELTRRVHFVRRPHSITFDAARSSEA